MEDNKIIDNSDTQPQQDNNTGWGLKDDYGNPINKDESSNDNWITQKLKAFGHAISDRVEDFASLTGVRNEKIKQKLELDFASQTNDPMLKDLPPAKRAEALLSAREYSFDYDSALKAGIAPKAIVEQLDPQVFNLEGAKEAGFSDEQIVQALSQKSKELRKAVVNHKLGVFSTSDIAKGIVHGFTRLGATEHDILNYIGLESDDYNTKLISQLHRANQAIKDGVEDDVAYNFGDLVSQAPLADMQSAKLGLYASALLMGNLTGGYMYGESRLDGGTQEQAQAQGEKGVALGFTVGLGLGLAGKTIGYAIGKYYDRVGAKGKQRALDMLVSEYRLHDENLDKIAQEYTKVMHSSGDTTTDKILGILYKYGGDKSKGGNTIKSMLADDRDLLIKSKGLRDERLKVIADEANKGQSLQDTLNNIISYHNKAVRDYADTINHIAATKAYTKKLGIELPDVDERLFADPDMLATYINMKNSLSVDSSIANLINHYKDLSALERAVGKSGGNRLNKLSTLKSKVDKAIEQTLSPDDYAKWRVANQQYAKSSEFLKNNVFGQTAVKASKVEPNEANAFIKKKTKGDVSHTAIINELLNKNIGENTFRELGNIIGHNKMADVERGYISETIKKLGNGDIDNVTLNTLANNLSKKGFVSEEGQNLHNLIEYMKDRFSLDDVINNVRLANPIAGAGIQDIGSRSADLVNKLTAGFLSQVFSQTKRVWAGLELPNVFGLRKSGETILAYDDLATLLKSEAGVRKAKEIINGVPKELAINTMQKLATSSQFTKALNPTATTNTGDTYRLPVLNSEAVYQKSLIDLARNGIPFTPEDINKLLTLRRAVQSKTVNSVEQLTKQIERIDLDVVNRAGIAPKDLAQALHDNGLDILFSNGKKMVKELQLPEVLYHNSSKKFEPTTLAHGKSTKFLGKGTYLSDVPDTSKLLHTYEYTIPKGVKVLELPDKEHYEYFMKSLGSKDRDYVNKLLRDKLGVDIIKVNYAGKTYYNIINENLHDIVKQTGVKK